MDLKRPIRICVYFGNVNAHSSYLLDSIGSDFFFFSDLSRLLWVWRLQRFKLAVHFQNSSGFFIRPVWVLVSFFSINWMFKDINLFKSCKRVWNFVPTMTNFVAVDKCLFFVQFDSFMLLSIMPTRSLMSWRTLHRRLVFFLQSFILHSCFKIESF